MTTMRAPAKINLALVVGPVRDDGLHEVATVLQRIELCDTVTLEPRTASSSSKASPRTRSSARALESLAAAAGVEPRWQRDDREAHPGRGRPRRRQLRRRDGAAARERLARRRRFAASACTSSRGRSAPTSRSSSSRARSSARATAPTLEPLELPQDYAVLLLLAARRRARSRRPRSTAASSGADGFERAPRARARRRCAGRRTADLARLPPNDLASSPLAARPAPARGVPRRRERRRARPSTASSPTAAAPSAPQPSSRGSRHDLGRRTRVVRLIHGTDVEGEHVVEVGRVPAAPPATASRCGSRRSRACSCSSHVIPHVAVYVLAIGALAFWVLAARNYSSTTARQLSWILAASQCWCVLVPLLLLLREVDCDPVDHSGGRGGALHPLRRSGSLLTVRARSNVVDPCTPILGGSGA